MSVFRARNTSDTGWAVPAQRRPHPIETLTDSPTERLYVPSDEPEPHEPEPDVDAPDRHRSAKVALVIASLAVTASGATGLVACQAAHRDSVTPAGSAARAKAARANAVGANAVGANAVGAGAVGAGAVGANAVGANAVGANAVGADAVPTKAVPGTDAHPGPASGTAVPRTDAQAGAVPGMAVPGTDVQPETAVPGTDKQPRATPEAGALAAGAPEAGAPEAGAPGAAAQQKPATLNIDPTLLYNREALQIDVPCGDFATIDLDRPPSLDTTDKRADLRYDNRCGPAGPLLSAAPGTEALSHVPDPGLARQGCADAIAADPLEADESVLVVAGAMLCVATADTIALVEVAEVSPYGVVGLWVSGWTVTDASDAGPGD